MSYEKDEGMLKLMQVLLGFITLVYIVSDLKDSEDKQKRISQLESKISQLELNCAIKIAGDTAYIEHKSRYYFEIGDTPVQQCMPLEHLTKWP